MSGKKYKGPLPLPKPTPLERFLGARSTNKPTNAEEQERIADRMAKKFKKSPKAQQYNKGGKVEKYFGGGAVRGMGKAYQGGKRSCKVR